MSGDGASKEQPFESVDQSTPTLDTSNRDTPIRGGGNLGTRLSLQPQSSNADNPDRLPNRDRTPPEQPPFRAPISLYLLEAASSIHVNQVLCPIPIFPVHLYTHDGLYDSQFNFPHSHRMNHNFNLTSLGRNIPPVPVATSSLNIIPKLRTSYPSTMVPDFPNRLMYSSDPYARVNPDLERLQNLLTSVRGRAPEAMAPIYTQSPMNSTLRELEQLKESIGHQVIAASLSPNNTQATTSLNCSVLHQPNDVPNNQLDLRCRLKILRRRQRLIGSKRRVPVTSTDTSSSYQNPTQPSAKIEVAEAEQKQQRSPVNCTITSSSAQIAPEHPSESDISESQVKQYQIPKKSPRADDTNSPNP